jgi:hypothetical protein
MSFILAAGTLHLSTFALRGLGWLAPAGTGARTDGTAETVITLVGLRAILVITYAFAGLHKLNDNFLSGSADLSAAGAVTDRLAGIVLGHPSAYLSKIVALVVPWFEIGPSVIFATRARIAPWLLIVLLAFHLPQISILGASDYPLIIASAFPATLSRRQWQRLRAVLLRPGLLTAAGGWLAICFHVGFARIALLTAFGILVAGWWGYFGAALVYAFCIRPLRDRWHLHDSLIDTSLHTS